MSKENAEALIKSYEDLLRDSNIVIANIDLNNPEDRTLALEVALRGKSEDEYFSIVRGIFQQADKENNKNKKDELNKLAGK